MSDQGDFDAEMMDVDPSQGAANDSNENVSESESSSENDSDSDDAGQEEHLNSKYLEILGQIRAQSFVYDNYVQLVQLAHQLNDLEKIRESCELFSSQYPLTPEIWLRWLQIETTIATSDEELLRVRGLFKRAFSDYFSVAIAQQYTNLATKVSNPQEIWDEIIPTYGLDCMEGSALFKEWREYYKKTLEDSPEKIQKLLEMFQYELSLPLSGIQEVYIEFLDFIDTADLEVELEKINEIYHKSKDNLYKMLTFEEKLVSLDERHHQERAATFVEYIEGCKSFLNEQMIQVLYERMVAACCLDASCWTKYLKYLQSRTDADVNENEKSPVFKQTVMDVLNRALRNCTWNADFYIQKIRLAEKQNYSKAEIIEIVQQALEVTNSDAKSNLNIWLEYLSYTKRHTDASNEKDVDLLRKLMELGLDSLGRRSADPNRDFDKLCAWIEYQFLQNYEQGYQYYDQMIKNANIQYKASLWIELAHFEIGRGIDNARKIFRRAIRVKNIDDFDSVMSSWKSFEHTHGSLDQIQDCCDVCDKIIENYNRFLKQNNSRTTTKRRGEPEARAESEKKKQKPNDLATKKPTFTKKSTEQKKPEAKNSIVERDPNEKDHVTVFLSNLSYDVTEKEVRTAFSDLQVRNVDLVMAVNGRGRGYGYLELSSPSEVEKALKLDRRPINDRPVYITKVLRDKIDRGTFKFSDGKDESRIFVKGLPFECTKEELENIFGKYGKIQGVRLVTRKDGKFKGIAFIDYEQDSSASKAVEAMNSQVFRGFSLTVAISNPPPKSDASKQSQGERSNAHFNREPKRPPRTEARPRLTFIPTSVQRNVTKPAPTGDTNGSDKQATPKSNDYFRQLLAKK